ncbi:P-loop NTPase [Methanohalophilus sp.]
MFLLSETSNVLLIHSPGGYGKSHLLMEIAFNASQIDPNREVLIITPRFTEMSDAIQNEIIEDKKYLLIYDDVDHYLDEIKSLLSYISFRNKNIKVILSARTSGLQDINAIINELPCKNSHEILMIEKWSSNDLIQLLRIAAGKDHVDDEEIIVNTFLNPYLVVWIGKQIKKDPVLKFDIIKDNFVSEINYEAEQCLSNVLETSIIKNFVLNLSLIVPFSQKDKNILQKLSILCSQSIEKTTQALATLTNVGILRIVGNSLRFNPDMKGDLYLAYNLKEINDKSTLKKLIENWIFISTENVFKNISATSKYEKTDILNEYCSELLNDWIENADNELGYYRKNKLNLLEKIVHIVPDKAFDLMYTYLDSPLPQISEQEYLRLNDFHPTTDDYGPILIRLLKIGHSREDVLDFISEIIDKVELGMYDNYKPNQLISTSISPIENNHILISDTLDILQNYTINSDKPIVENLSTALSELLSGTYHISNYGFGKVSWGNIVLSVNPELISTRRKALAIVKTMINHNNVNLRLSAIEIISNIGRVHSRSERELSLVDEISDERKAMIHELSKYISIDEDFRVLNSIENLFLEWWAQGKYGTNEVADLLKKFPKNIEYTVFKYFNSIGFVIENFSLLENEAPTAERWKWFAHNYMHRSSELKSEDFKHLAISLNNKYNTEDQIVEYLKDLHSIVELNLVGSLIIDCWVRTNLDIFLSIRNDKSLWEQVPFNFQNVIDLAIANQNKEFIQKICDEVFFDLSNVNLKKVETLLKIIGINVVDNEFIDSCINQFIENGNSEIRKSVLQYLYFIYGTQNNFNSLIYYLQLIIRKETSLDSILIENLFFQVQNIKNYEKAIDIDLLKNFKKDLLEILKILPKLDWHAKELLDYSLTNIDDVVSFLEKRISIDTGIPYDGIEQIKNHIHSLKDYEKVVDNLLLLSENKNDLVQISIDTLLHSIAGIENSLSDKLYSEDYIMCKLNIGDFSSSAYMLKYIPFKEETVDIFVYTSKKASSSSDIQTMTNIFYHIASTEKEAQVSNVGSAPPVLLMKKNLFQRIYNGLRPGKLRTVIKECIKEIDNKIDRSLKYDEEFLDEKIY